jgi:hypothetical protein
MKDLKIGPRQKKLAQNFPKLDEQGQHYIDTLTEKLVELRELPGNQTRRTNLKKASKGNAVEP